MRVQCLTFGPLYNVAPYHCAGLQAGQVYNADRPGEAYVGDPEEAHHAEEQQEQEPAAAAVGSSKQQQREAARLETLQRKVDSGQKMLTFMAYDKAVLAQFPEFVQQQVPFLTTAKGAIDLQLLEFTKALAVSNVAFSNIANRLEELTHNQYYSRQLLYYSYAKEADAAAAAVRGENTVTFGGCLLIQCWYACGDPGTHGGLSKDFSLLLFGNQLFAHFTVLAGGNGQRTMDNMAGSRHKPPPYPDKGGLYSQSPGYLIDLFLSSTEESRE